jgi:LuxR family transcriptional regulator, maltose regulon positive regulatory protein
VIPATSAVSVLRSPPRGVPVLASKLRPADRSSVVVRQALLDRLSEDQPARLTVVIAPAGSGKTSLLRDWRAADRVSRTAWLSLDRHDNDPVRFWAHVIAALASETPGFGATIAPTLAEPGTVIRDSVLPVLINDLTARPARLTLVLDDFHLVCSQEILADVAFLVEQLSSALRLVLAARSDPPLPLARLRARGELTEIRGSDLRFTHAEAGALLNQGLGLDLAYSDIRALRQRTEGWAAGLYLAGLSLRGRSGPLRLTGPFAAGDRQVADYLNTEVLDGLTPEVRSFLLRTSVLDWLEGPLCDALTGSSDSRQMLERIERSNLFLIPLDSNRQKYRYHHVFARVLRHELERTEPGWPAVLHRRASAWHRAHGSAAAAIDHAMAAADLAEASDLIVSQWNSYLNEGQAETVQSWLDRLPPEMVVADSRLCLVSGWLARHGGRLDEVEPWIEAAEAGTPGGSLRLEATSVEPAARMLRAGRRHMIGDLAGTSPAVQQAMERPDAGGPGWRAVTLATRGASLFWRGQLDAAVTVLEQVTGPVRLPADNLASLWALGCLAAIYARTADLGSAIGHIRLAAALAAEHGLGDCWVTATAVVTWADILERQGQLPEAEAAARRGLELARRGRATLETAWALLCLARIRFRAGDRPGARTQLDAARHIVASCANPGVLAGRLADTEHSLTARTGTASRRAQSAELLSRREQEILQWLPSRLTLREIAAQLFISYYTVKTHTRHIYRKLGVATRAQAAAHADDSGGGAGGVLAQVSDQTDHVLRDEAADRAGGVDADNNLAGLVEDESGGLQKPAGRVDEGAGRLGDRGSGGAVSDRERQPMLGDQLRGGRFVVDRQRDHAHPGLGQRVAGALESP